MEETKEMFKSIFRQRVYEKIAKVSYRISAWGSWKEKNIEYEANFIQDDKIAEYDALPLLSVDDKIFLVDLNKLVYIKDRVKSTDGSVIYYIENKSICSDKTLSSEAECKKIMREQDQIQSLMTQLDEEKKKFIEYCARYKYEHRFFNF